MRKTGLSTTRETIEAYIVRQPVFRTALEPVQIEAEAPAVIRLMAAAASRTHVGPMAAVAGALHAYDGVRRYSLPMRRNPK